MNVHWREVYASLGRNLSILIAAQAEFDTSIGSPSIIPTFKHISERTLSSAEYQIKFKR